MNTIPSGPFVIRNDGSESRDYVQSDRSCALRPSQSTRTSFNGAPSAHGRVYRSIRTENGLDPEAQVAVLLHESAQQTKELAQSVQHRAQQDRIALLSQAAKKLNEMADRALYSSIFQGVSGMLSSTCSFLSGKAMLSGQNGTQKLWEAGSRALDAIGRCDVFAIQQQRLAAQKQQIEIHAERKGTLMQEQGDSIENARRMESASMDMLTKMVDLRHATVLNALKL